MEDAYIIDLFFRRDEKALRETASKYGSRLAVIARTITENEQDTEECVNDTYLEAWQSIPPTRPIHLFAFLAKIIRHNALSVCERKRDRAPRHGYSITIFHLCFYRGGIFFAQISPNPLQFASKLCMI